MILRRENPWNCLRGYLAWRPLCLVTCSSAAPREACLDLGCPLITSYTYSFLCCNGNVLARDVARNCARKTRCIYSILPLLLNVANFSFCLALGIVPTLFVPESKPSSYISTLQSRPVHLDQTLLEA